MKVKSRKDARSQRHLRIRKRVQGTPECPRLAVMVSNQRIYAQVIDDQAGVTLASVASGKGENPTVDVAKAMGVDLGGKAKEKGISNVVIDRGGFRYHGRVKALVDGVVEAGVRNTKEAE